MRLYFREFAVIVCAFFILKAGLNAQVIFTPAKSPVYEFMEKMSTKGVFNYYDIVIPISRKQIADYLKEIDRNSPGLTRIEREELDEYINEYFYELNQRESRWRLFNYSDSLFRLFVTPIIKGELISKAGKTGWKRKWLGRFDGSIDKYLGFSFSLTDNAEGGDTIDALKKFSPSTGFYHKTSSDGTIEYEDINALLTYSWKWGFISFGKDYQNWGSGRRGQLILSSKAPSFPFVKFNIHPTAWLHFQYLHGFLASGVTDSLSMYPTTVRDKNNEPVFRSKQKNKYFAANLLSIIPVDGLIFTIGNSIIYSDGDVKLPFLIPFIWYYKGIDHNFYGSTTDDGYGNNGQLFFDFSTRLIRKFHFYTTLFIDEFSLSGFLKGDHSRDQLGYTLGMTSYGVFDNLFFETEYTRIMPGTYLNYIPTQTYEHASYSLGHWIGQNADQLYAALTYTLFKNFDIKLFYENIRKGGSQKGTDFNALKINNFLYKPVAKWFKTGVEITYQAMNDLTLNGILYHDQVTLENRREKSNNFSLLFSYGL